MAAIDEAVALGVTMLDTAEVYAAGASETIIGRWFATRPRSMAPAVRIATKVAPPWFHNSDERLDSAYIAGAFERSLERLGTDRVELLMIHAPDDTTPVEDTIEALEAIRASGRAVRIGACNLDAAHLHAALDAAEKLGVAGYQVIQNGFNLLFVNQDRDVQAICAERGLAYTAYSPLGGGVLTGKYRPGEPPPEGTRLASFPQSYPELLTPAVHDAIEQLRRAAIDRGWSCGALALAWVLHHDAVTACIPGPARTAPHLAVADEALRCEVDADLHAEITDWFLTALG